jgi:hypothetical protein
LNVLEHSSPTYESIFVNIGHPLLMILKLTALSRAKQFRKDNQNNRTASFVVEDPAIC